MWKDAVLCFFLLIHSSKPGEVIKDYIKNESTGHSYKLMYQSATWEVARDTCKLEGAKLAVPKTKEEFLFIQKIVRGMHYPSVVGAQKYRYLAWIGVSNLEDYRVWKNVDGEDILTTNFHDWAAGNGADVRPDPKEPHCVAIDAINPGFRQFWCDLAQPYICEKRA